MLWQIRDELHVIAEHAVQVKGLGFVYHGRDQAPAGLQNFRYYARTTGSAASADNSFGLVGGTYGWSSLVRWGEI